jgi:hypothetical protein
MAWTPAQTPLLQRAMLYADGHESVCLERLDAGCTIPSRSVAGGEEFLVVSGEIRREGDAEALGRWTWSRNAHERQPPLHSRTGALLWVKRGHLPAA